MAFAGGATSEDERPPAERRRTVFSLLAQFFTRKKKRHNTEVSPSRFSRPLTRAEFLSIYESMPESARVKLFASLEHAQKERLLALLSGPNPEIASQSQTEERRWDAEDFLPERDERKVKKLRQIKELRDLKSVFAAMESYPAAAVAQILNGESATIAGMVLLQLTHKFTSEVLKVLPELKRGEIVRAMAAERRVASDALVAMAKKVSAKLEALPREDHPRIDGVRHANEILKLLGVDEAQRITREVFAADAQLARKLEASRYTFDNLVELNARDFRTLFSAIPDENLWARALKAMDGNHRKSMLGKLPLKRAGLIVNAMNALTNSRLDGIDKARNRILAEALKLAGRQEIHFAGFRSMGTEPPVNDRR